MNNESKRAVLKFDGAFESKIKRASVFLHDQEVENANSESHRTAPFMRSHLLVLLTEKRVLNEAQRYASDRPFDATEDQSILINREFSRRVVRNTFKTQHHAGMHGHRNSFLADVLSD